MKGLSTNDADASARAAQPAADRGASCSHCGARFNPRSTSALCPACLMASSLSEVEPGPADAPPDPRAPFHAQSFGDFDLLEEAGRGGMGVVYRARQRGAGRLVALKLLHPGRLVSQGEVARFQREAETIARLEHPNILPLYSAGQHRGQPWCAVRWMEGGALAARLNGAKPRLPAREAAELLLKIALAVHHAHQRGVLHRDLKPANILLDASGEPVVADFGLARLLDSDSALTRTGAFFGSPAYTAPEQAASDAREITVAADVYGLGAILYELLTGRPPFAGKDTLDTLRRVVENAPALPRTIHPGVSPDLETICLKCLEKEPEGRYQTARELAEELDRFLKDEPILARPISFTARLWRWRRRKPALAASFVLLLALLIILGIGGPLTALRVNEARQMAEARELEARRIQYASDTRLAHQAEIDGDLRATRRLLDRHARLERGKPDFRGWEWRYLWRQSQGTPRVVLAEHAKDVWAVGLLPGGQGAYSAGLDGVVKLLDPASRRITGELRHEDQVSIGVPSPDGRWFVTLTRQPNGGDGRKPVVVWDLPARRETGVVITNVWPRESTLAISPDSKMFAFVDQTDPEYLMVRELPSGREIARFSAQTDLMDQQGVAFTPDGGTLVFSANVEGALALVDTREWREVGRLNGHRRNVAALAVSPDGRWLASASKDRSLRLWDLRLRQEVAARHELTSESWSVAFSPDGKRLAASIGHAIPIFSVPALDPISEIRSPSGGVDSVAFVSDRELLAGARSGSAALYSLDTRAGAPDGVRFKTGLAQFLWDSKSCGPAISLSPDNAALLGVFTNGAFAVWQLPGLESTGELPLPVANFSCAAISARGEMVAFADLAGNVVLWRAADGQVTTFGKPGTVGFSRMAFSLDGRRLAFGGFGRRYSIWDVPSRKETHSFDGAKAGVCMALKFSPDSHALAAGLFTGVALYWPLDQPGTQRTLQVADQQVQGMAFADRGNTLITARGDAGFWDLSSGVQTRHLTDLAGQAFSIALSPDETRMAIGFVEGSVSIFDRGSGEEVMRLKAFDLNVRHVAFSADGNTLIAASSEQIRVWRAAPSSETDGRQPSNTTRP